MLRKLARQKRPHHEMEQINQDTLPIQNVYLETKAKNILLIQPGLTNGRGWITSKQVITLFYCSHANRRNLLPHGFSQKHEETYEPKMPVRKFYKENLNYTLLNYASLCYCICYIVYS